MNMENKGNVMIMGGNIPHRELILKIKERGYFTILVDYLDNPAAKDVADLHIQESILDVDKVMAIAEQYKPKFIANLCVDRAMVPTAYVCEKLGIHNFVDYEQSINVTDKCSMKKVFQEHGIKTSAFYTVTKETDLSDYQIYYPVVVKPADASGSIGVKKILTQESLHEYLPKAFEISRSGGVVIEEFCDDLEVSIDCFVQDDKIDILLVRQKMKQKSMDSLVYPLGSIILNEYPCDSEENIRKMARKIVDTFKLKNTPFFLQAFINQAGELSMIEFGVRIGGGMSYQIIKSSTGFDIMDAALDCYEQKIPQVVYHRPNHVYSTNYIFTNPGIFSHIEGYEKLLEDGTIDKFVTLAAKGHHSDGVVTSRNKTGYFFIHADNILSLFEKTRYIVSQLDVKDEQGNSIMKKELFEETLSYIEPYYS